jgi:hypothetical protein
MFSKKPFRIVNECDFVRFCPPRFIKARRRRVKVDDGVFEDEALSLCVGRHDDILLKVDKMAYLSLTVLLQIPSKVNTRNDGNTYFSTAGWKAFRRREMRFKEEQQQQSGRFIHQTTIRIDPSILLFSSFPKFDWKRIGKRTTFINRRLRHGHARHHQARSGTFKRRKRGRGVIPSKV